MMKHYINPETNEIYAYAADGSQDDYIKPGLQPIDNASLAALRAQVEALAPTVCTPYQFHEALNIMGLTDAVNAAAAQNRSIQNAMQFAPEFKRDHPKIAEMAQAIGKTDADIDALFALAVTLNP
jgi:hypothetical protein